MLRRGRQETRTAGRDRCRAGQCQQFLFEHESPSPVAPHFEPGLVLVLLIEIDNISFAEEFPRL
jgi:hypothetical protein